jgi:hypothetical protein
VVFDLLLSLCILTYLALLWTGLSGVAEARYLISQVLTSMKK